MFPIGYQETWIIPDDDQDFPKMLNAYQECAKDGYYDKSEGDAAQPRSVILLKRQMNEIPAETKLMWATGDRSMHNAEGLFGDKLPDGIKFHIVPIETVLNENSVEIKGIDLTSEHPTENEYMKRYDISQIKLPEIEPKELPSAVGFNRSTAPEGLVSRETLAYDVPTAHSSPGLSANVTPLHADKSPNAPMAPPKEEKSETGASSALTEAAGTESIPARHFDSAQIWMIEQGMEKGLDVAVYADIKYDWQQMHVIRCGLEAGLDVSALCDPAYSHKQMETILHGLRQGFDVSVFADKKYSAEQMKEIAAGMESGVNTSLYADTQYTWLQMMEIRKGVENGIDVSVYRNSAFTDSQMRQFRTALLSNQAAAKPDRAFVRFPLLERALKTAKERLDDKLSGWLRRVIDRPKKKRAYER